MHNNYPNMRNKKLREIRDKRINRIRKQDRKNTIEKYGRHEPNFLHIHKIKKLRKKKQKIKDTLIPANEFNDQIPDPIDSIVV